MVSNFKSEDQRKGFFGRYQDNSQNSSKSVSNSTTLSHEPKIIAKPKASEKPNDEEKKLREKNRQKEKELEAIKNKHKVDSERNRHKEISIQLAITKKHQRILSDLISRRITPEEAVKMRLTGSKAKSDESYMISPAFVSDQ